MYKKYKMLANCSHIYFSYHNWRFFLICMSRYLTDILFNVLTNSLFCKCKLAYVSYCVSFWGDLSHLHLGISKINCLLYSSSSQIFLIGAFLAKVCTNFIVRVKECIYKPLLTTSYFSILKDWLGNWSDCSIRRTGFFL